MHKEQCSLLATIFEIYEHLFGVFSQAVGPSRSQVECCNLKLAVCVPLVLTCQTQNILLAKAEITPRILGRNI